MAHITSQGLIIIWYLGTPYSFYRRYSQIS